MIMLGLKMTGDIPFRTVYLHGLIKVNGEKMSKVKGNVLNPLDLIDEYGTDALRLTLVSGTTPGNDTQIAKDRLTDNRNFVNKLWNAGRFVKTNVERWPTRDLRAPLVAAPGVTSEADRWIVSRANEVTAHATRLLEDFQLGEAVRTIRDFLWGDFCDWYLEIAKVELRNAESADERQAIQTNLAWVFEHTLRLLHPMAPFVTEELWQTLVRGDERGGNGASQNAPRSGGAGSEPLPPSIMLAPWPAAADERAAQAESRIAEVIEIVSGVRNVRAEYRVDPGRWVPATIVSADAATYRRLAPVIGELPATRLRPIEVVSRLDQPIEHAVTIVAGGATVYVPLAGMVDVAQERARLERERAELETEIERSKGLLARPGFVEKARPDVVAREREKLAGLEDRLGKLEEHLRTLE
jgi:valyl-tRNA synthetase